MLEGDSSRQLIFKQRSIYLVWLVMLLSVIILIGWWFDIAFIIKPFSQVKVMNPTGAVCFIVLSFAFLLVNSRGTKRGRYKVARLLAFVPLTVSILNLLDAALGLHTNVDEILFSSKVKSQSPEIANLMATSSTICFGLLGLAQIFVISYKKPLRKIANWLVVVTVILAVFSIVGYSYQVKEFFDGMAYFPMSIQTSIIFMVFGLAFLFSNTEGGFMRMIASTNHGGTIARILIPAGILVPVTIGYLRLVIHWTSGISTELGATYLITGTIILFFILILFVSVIINRKDVQQKEAERQLEFINSRLENKIEERTAEVIRNEKKFRALIENSFDSITLLDANLNTTYHTSSTNLLAGYNREERRIQSKLNPTHPDDRAELQKTLEQVMKNPGKPFKIEFRVKHKEGHDAWMDGVFTNMLHDPNVESIVVNVREITERKDAEQKLLANERRFRAILENNADAVVISDEKLKAIYQSPSASRMTGITLEMRQSSPALTFAHPEDVSGFRKSVNLLLEHPGSALPFQVRMAHGKGHYIWIEGVMTNLLHDPSVKGIIFNYRDITERKEIEKKINDNERRFRALIENISDAIVMNAEDSSILYQSPSVERILGYSWEEREGQLVLNYVHPEDQNRFLDLYKELRKTPGKALPFQYRFLHKNGNFVWLEGVVTNLVHEPSVGAYVANYRNVTERKETEEKLMRERSLLRTLIDNVPDYIYVKDLNSKHLINNKAMVRLLGAETEEETIGKSSDYFFGPSVANPYLDEDKKIIASGVATIDHEETTITPAGEHKYLLTTKVPLKDQSGRVTGIVGISHDITHQKQIELDLRNSKFFLEKAQETGHVGHWILEVKTNKLLWSTETCRIYGLTPEEFDERLETSYQLTHPEDLKKIQASISIAIEDNYAYSVDHRILLRDGTVKWVHEQGETTVDEYGRAVLLIGIVHDITQQKESEQKIMELNAELEERVNLRTQQLQEANREMEAFTYSVSHDLRAPLRIVDGFSQILLEDQAAFLNESARKNINVIIRNAKRMGQLIDDLLDFSRLGRAEINLTSINMSQMVKEVLEEISFSGIKLPAQLIVQELPSASGDLNLIKQVWLNLLTNAIKYSSKKDEPCIEIGTTNDQSNVIYYVKDNGAGFDMQYYKKLFGVFQRLHKEHEFSGTGVGLALVHRIITRHSGKVWAEAKLNEGCTFFFCLP